MFHFDVKPLKVNLKLKPFRLIFSFFSLSTKIVRSCVCTTSIIFLMYRENESAPFAHL